MRSNKHIGIICNICIAVAIFAIPRPAYCDSTPVLPPNVVWVIVEDMSAHFSCYGEKVISTPNVDKLASDGVRFTKAFVTAPICSISRSALITGRYQTSIGAQNHRSNVPGHEVHLPGDVELVPSILRKCGYHTNNLTLEVFLKSRPEAEKNPKVSIAKTDYNFVWDKEQAYDANHWDVRPEGKPFFVQIQLQGGKYRINGDGTQWPERVQRDLGSVTRPEDVILPPYLPDNPIIRKDWAQYLDTVRYTDWEVGKVVERLKQSNQYENTVIFFLTDHGISHIRNKQFLYDGGIHVPLIVCGSGIDRGQVRSDVVEHIDLAATSIELAGFEPPKSMHAKNILSKNYMPREFVYSARDRADETVDLIRSVRDVRWKYIFNGFPDRPYLQPNNYKDNKPIVRAMRQLHSRGLLNAKQALIMADTRPKEELYDVDSDPFELNNIAGESAHQWRLERMRNALKQWQLSTGDLAEPESEETYRLEVEGSHVEAGKNNMDQQYHSNVELMLKWLKEKPLRK